MSRRGPCTKGGEEGGNRERAAARRSPYYDVSHIAIGVYPVKDLKKIEEVCFLYLGKIPSEDMAPLMLTAIHDKVICHLCFAVSGTSI